MTKTCSCCKTEKSAIEFHKDSTKKDGLSSKCKPCATARAMAQYRDGRFDPAARRAAHRRWVAANPQKMAAHYSRYQKANRGKRNAIGAKRHAAKLKRTPTWLSQAELAEIEGVYHFAKVMEQTTGRKHHVDHVVSLQGATVSGLHVPWNLRAIPAHENQVKANRLQERA